MTDSGLTVSAGGTPMGVGWSMWSSRYKMAASPRAAPSVLKSSLISIFDTLSTEDIQPWSKSIDHDNQTYRRVKKLVSDVFVLVSGGDVVGMIADVLTMEQLRQLPHSQSLQSLAAPFNDLDGGTRRPMLQALKKSGSLAGVQHKELTRMGFQIRQDTFQACDKPEKHNEDVSSPGRPSPGRALEPHIDRLLRTSSVPVNRSVVAGPENRSKSHPRRLDSTYRELYDRFEDKDQITYRTFLRHCDNSFLSYTRPTDCCDFCLEGRQAERSLAHYGAFIMNPNYPFLNWW